MGIKFLLLAGLGGGIGSVFRASLAYLFSSQNLLATGLANVGGAFLVGFLTKWAVCNSGGEFFRAFWIIGICGGFTTFSTFGMDLFTLLEKGSLIWAFLYILANFLGTLFFIWIGFKVANLTLS